MANHYLQTAFAIPLMPQEAILLKECFAIDPTVQRLRRTLV